MSKFTDKISNITNSLGYWFTGGVSKETPIGRLVLLALSILVPIVLILIAPWLAWLSIAPEHRYYAQYNWLQDLQFYWPLSIGILLFLATVGGLIYYVVKQNKDLSQWAKDHPNPNDIKK